MNFSVRALNCFYITIRRFQCPTVNLSISAEARILGKIMRGSKKAKKSRYIPQDASHLVVPELVGESAKGNAKVTNRRVSVLNSLYLEKITDLMSSSEFDRKLLDHGFVITRVNYVLNGSALNVYWTSDSEMIAIHERMFEISRRLRHELTQLHCGRVPHINFIKDHNMFKATDVEELLKMADFGEDDPNELKTVEVEEKQPFADLVKSSKVLAIDREAIMNQLLQSINHQPKPVVKSSQSLADSFQRDIDFKKYLRSLKIVETKRKEERRCRENSPLNAVDLRGDGGEEDYEEEYDYHDSFSSEHLDR